MSRNRRIFLGTLILLVATFLRIYAFGEVPPGLQHDEIFKAEEGLRLAQEGDFRLFYPTNQGHEGAFVWLLALSHMLVGTNILMIKLPAFICGILTVALIFRFGWRNYSSLVGFTASGITAVSFWAVFTSRVGLRAVMLPVVVLLVLIGLSHILRQSRWRTVLLTGLALGFAIYTYTSAFILHFVYLLFVPLLWLIKRDVLSRVWREFIAVGVLAILVMSPMIYIRVTDPDGANRVNSITTPLQQAQAGNPQMLIDNAIKLAGIPAFVGDPTWRYNVSGRALFLLPIGLLVYLGIGFAVLRIRRNPLNLMIIGLAIFGIIPSLLTVLAPSFLRSIVMLPSIMLLIGIAVWELTGIMPKSKQWIGWIIALVIIVATGIADFNAYFIQWAQSRNPILTYHDEMEQGATVYEIYRDDLEQLARYLSESDHRVVFVSTPNSELDPLIYKFSGAPSSDKVHVVFFHAFANIVLSEQPTLLLVSPLSPISEKHAEWVTEENGTRRLEPILRQDGEIAFEVYEVSGIDNVIDQRLQVLSSRPIFFESAGEMNSIEFPINFGDLLLFRAIEIPRETVFGERDGVNNQLYFQPLVTGSSATVKVFMHLIDDTGKLVAQRDLLDIPPAYWHENMIFIQDNFVPFWERVPAGTYQLVMGVYDWTTGVRLPILNAEGNSLGDRLFLGEIEVVDRED